VQRIRELTTDRVIAGRIGCAVAGTVAVLVGSPPPWVLIVASCVLLTIATVECTAARRRVLVPARSAPGGSGRS
jgi:hypothetical protein